MVRRRACPRESGEEMQRNAKIGLLTKSSKKGREISTAFGYKKAVGSPPGPPTALLVNSGHKHSRQTLRKKKVKLKNACAVMNRVIVIYLLSPRFKPLVRK
jgi:hypothetical protein